MYKDNVADEGPDEYFTTGSGSGDEEDYIPEEIEDNPEEIEDNPEEIEDNPDKKNHGNEDKNSTVKDSGNVQKAKSYKQDTKSHKTTPKYTKTLHSTVTAGHKVIVDNNGITVGNVITLGVLNEMFNQRFTNGHLLVYIDGELVFNATVGDDLTAVILEIIDKFLGKHEIKLEFTDGNGKTNTYNKTMVIE